MQRAEFFDVSSERWQAKVSGAVTLGGIINLLRPPIVRMRQRQANFQLTCFTAGTRCSLTKWRRSCSVACSLRLSSWQV